VLRCVASPESAADILAGALAGTIGQGERAVTAPAASVENHVMTAQAA
jgi:hypothetical protein